MPDRRPALFFDFDNTITCGDVLDTLIERYSATGEWREWEAMWQEGRMSTVECLSRQVGGLRIGPEALQCSMLEVVIDPHFAPIVAWAGASGVELEILSDNFSSLIRVILENHGLGSVPVFANELGLHEGRYQAQFPWRDPGCARCAHCKAQHLRAARERPRIFVGDGLSDVCPSLVADVVFAKGSLAAELSRRGVAFTEFRTLEEVLQVLRSSYGTPAAA